MRPVQLKIPTSIYGSTQIKDNRLSCPEAEEGTKHKASLSKQGPALNDLLHNFNTATLKEKIKLLFYKCFFFFLLKILQGKGENHMMKFFLM